MWAHVGISRQALQRLPRASSICIGRRQRRPSGRLMHRLCFPILSCSQVLEAGVVVEQDAPGELLARPGSRFGAMLRTLEGG